jgi:hypothetical protein
MILDLGFLDATPLRDPPYASVRIGQHLADRPVEEQTGPVARVGHYNTLTRIGRRSIPDCLVALLPYCFIPLCLPTPVAFLPRKCYLY